MDVASYFRGTLRELHGSLDEAVRDLSTEQLHHRPGGLTNHIGFVLWHSVRTEDNLIRFVFQRQPTVWMEGGWDKRFGLDSKAQGTGLSPEEAGRVHISSLPDFLTYARKVWGETDAYLGTLKPEDMEKKVLVRPLGERTIQQIFSTTFLTHGYSHLGEVWALRGVQGIKGTAI